MKFKLKMNPHGQVYLPVEIRKDLLKGKKKLELHPDLNTGLLIPTDQDPRNVLDSLETLHRHFEQIVREKKRRKKEGSNEG